jgi:hypothetical protein
MKAFRVGLAVGLGLVLISLVGPVEADDLSYPHIHYRGQAFRANGTTPFTQAFSLSPVSLSEDLAPPNCYDGGKSGADISFSTGQYSIRVAVLDTPACVAAMQNFNPPPSAFPNVTATGWVFRRQ